VKAGLNLIDSIGGLFGGPQASADSATIAMASAGGAIPETRFGDDFRTDLLWEKLDAMAQQMSGADLFQAEAVAIASGLIVSVGYVVWTQRTCYLLVSVLMSTPLWREFDPLAVLDFQEKGSRAGKRRRGDGDKAPLLSLLDRVSKRNRSAVSSN
jgi:hypothetical protein